MQAFYYVAERVGSYTSCSISRRRIARETLSYLLI